MPELQRLPLGQTMLPWRADPDGMSFYVYDTVTSGSAAGITTSSTAASRRI